MRPKQSSVKGDLDSVAYQSDTHLLSAVAVADAVGGAGEADRTMGVDNPQNLAAFGRTSRPPRVVGASIHLVVVVDEVASGVCRDNDSVVRDVKQPIDDSMVTA
jgi:hypothetical protein